MRRLLALLVALILLAGCGGARHSTVALHEGTRDGREYPPEPPKGW